MLCAVCPGLCICRRRGCVVGGFLSVIKQSTIPVYHPISVCSSNGLCSLPHFTNRVTLAGRILQLRDLKLREDGHLRVTKNAFTTHTFRQSNRHQRSKSSEPYRLYRHRHRKKRPPRARAQIAPAEAAPRVVDKPVYYRCTLFCTLFLFNTSVTHVGRSGLSTAAPLPQ